MSAPTRCRGGFMLSEVGIAMLGWVVVATLAAAFVREIHRASNALAQSAAREATAASILRQLHADTVRARRITGVDSHAVRIETIDRVIVYGVEPDGVLRRCEGEPDHAWKTPAWQVSLSPASAARGDLLEVTLSGRSVDVRAGRAHWLRRVTLRAMVP
ncbi:MAG: hypothetical protein L6Q92_06125 [Phycisphaerae bacterium]|nr:hypothetical protein [Phycisphaerae bacterium]